jgi:uncharacterized protein (DUF433 family)
MSFPAVACLTSSPDVCGGRVRLDGTRITVNQLATLYKQGYSGEEIADQYPHLNLAQVYAALAYYHANRDKVESDLALEATEAETLTKRFNYV